MFLNPVLRRKLILKQKLNNDINNNPLIPKHQEERFTLQSDYKYNEEYKKIVILDKSQIQDKLSSSDEESDHESHHEEIIEIPEKIKDNIQDDIKEITIDLEALNPTETEEITSQEEDEKDKEEDKVEEVEDDNDQEGGTKENLKNIVVHSFF